MRIELHCHSHYSDGSLSPKELIKKAEENAIKIFAITDHDNIDAYQELSQLKTDIKIVSGIEFSTTWNKIGIHIVGLNFDVHSEQLQQAIQLQKQARISRAKIISAKLEKYGLSHVYEKISSQDKVRQIGRPDFAQYLVKHGVFKDCEQAFKKFLGAGKPGDVKNQWLDLEKIVTVIRSAGGIAVLAHPFYYKLTNSKLKRLLTDFKNFGGEALEVVNGYQNRDRTRYMLKLCTEFGLKASIGSDFHRPTSWNKLGCDSRMLGDIDVVWNNF